MRWPRIVFLLVFLLIVGVFFHYTLPQRDIVRITGTEVVREDFTSLNRWFFSNNENGTTASGSRDIRFINAVRANGDVIVYRNEDTGFGWPPYFKLDTADLQARATSLVSPEAAPQWVAISHYGWRMHFPTAYPNAVGLRPVAGPDVTFFPWFNIVILLILAGLVFLAWRMWERFKDRVIDPIVDRIAVRWAKFRDWMAGHR